MSRSSENITPVVPLELEHFLEDAQVVGTIEQWQNADYNELMTAMPYSDAVDIGDRTTRVVTLVPDSGDVDESRTLVMGLPHQQAWKPSMYLRAEFMRQIVAPNSRAIILPNNSAEVTKPYYRFTREERGRLNGGDIRPMAEMQTRTLEQLDLGNVIMTGYSLGATSALGIAAVGSDKINITHLNLDELPSAERDAKQLQKDFMKSGGWADQRAAIADSALPAIAKALSAPRLAVDYMNFGVSTLNAENKALAKAMAGTADEAFETALELYPAMQVKIGRVVGSLLLDDSNMIYPRDRVRGVTYTGLGTHKHATGDNIVAHALMVKDAL